MLRHVCALRAVRIGLALLVAAANVCVSARAAPASGHELTAVDLESFLDGLVPLAIQREDVAGAVVSVVKGDQLLFAKGYGYADLAARTPVSARDTLFRPGSISKLFTWTAVMQQVEQGKLDLDTDVNAYLDFEIPAKFGKPITLRHLMTHTAGFEDSFKGLFVRTARELRPAANFLRAQMPQRIFPPGQVVSYSNYGTALAGYIVERVARQPYEEYVAESILRPLRMTRSTFAQPLPPELAGQLSKAYASASDAQPQSFEIIQPVPAGAMSTTATDMAQFMIAQLRSGQGADARILQPETVSQMHTQAYEPASGMNGFRLGFYEENRNGQRIIGHLGDTLLFHSDLHLMLDAGVGFFISLNSTGRQAGANGVRTQVFRAFLDRYFPYTPKDEPTIATAAADAERVAGWYEPSQRIESALGLFRLLRQTKVSARPDGTIEVSYLRHASGASKRWREVGPLVYREVGGQSRLAFVADAEGKVTHWTTDEEPPIMVFQRVTGLKQQGAVLLLLSLSFVVLLGALAVWCIGGLARRRFGLKLELTPLERRFRFLSRLGVAFQLAAITGALIITLALASDPHLLLYAAADPWLCALYVGGSLALLGGVTIVVDAGAVLLRSRREAVRATGEMILAFVAVYVAWFVLTFGLASFSTRY